MYPLTPEGHIISKEGSFGNPALLLGRATQSPALTTERRSGLRALLYFEVTCFHAAEKFCSIINRLCVCFTAHSATQPITCLMQLR
jgi:hypothetical protein